MNKPWLLLLALWLALPAAAQSPGEEAAERTRIATERSGIEAAFEQAQRECYAKFAVNDCLARARAKRRDAMAVLRAQELTLDDADRQRRAAERVRELDERRDEQARQRDEARVRGEEQRRQQQEAAAAKEQEARQKQAAARSRAPGAEATRDRKQAPDVQENLRRHNERLTEAQEHKDKIQQRAAKEGPPAKSLPLPP